MIGEGSYGVVWLCKDHLSEGKVAVKIYKDLLNSDVRLLKAVLGEITILRELSAIPNDYTVKLLDILLPNNPEYLTEIAIVMEYLPYTLEQVMSKPQLFELRPHYLKTILSQLLQSL